MPKHNKLSLPSLDASRVLAKRCQIGANLAMIAGGCTSRGRWLHVEMPRF